MGWNLNHQLVNFGLLGQWLNFKLANASNKNYFFAKLSNQPWHDWPMAKLLKLFGITYLVGK